MPNSLELLGCFRAFGVSISPACQIRTVSRSSCRSLVRVLDLKPRFLSPSLRRMFCFSLRCQCSDLETPSDGVDLPPSCSVLETCLASSHSPFSLWLVCPRFSLLLERDVRQQGTALSQL